jgi:hypothetical protein
MRSDGSEGAGRDVSDILVREFAFLDDLGFRVAETSPDAVTWTRGDRSLLISWDRRDGFLDTHLSSRGAEPLSFGLRHALSAMGREDLLPAHGWHALRPATQRAFVSELATLVRGPFAGFLDAPRAQWETAHQLCSDEAYAYTQEVNSRQWRVRAESARAARDWHEVVRWYGHLIDEGLELTAAESARLRYAHHILGQE